MIRQTFERDMQKLQEAVLALGDNVANNITDSVAILKRRDLDGARRLIAADRRINEKRIELEMACFTLLATQQPMAGDLRTIASMLAIVIELERINDYAKGIGRITLMLGAEPLLKPLVDIPVMAEKARSMLERSLTAFARRDEALARAIPPEDDMVDDLYNQVFRDLMDRVIEDPTTVDQANYLLWAAHNLERTADRVINICERVVYMVTGELTELG
ncbi:MAG: phosphate signaling complex protein PhoU [Chloroflexota bacterium]|jgi:phosphate transport system protein